MINAGIGLKGFQGSQRYEDERGVWVGVVTYVNYPQGQNETDNPPSEGDVVIEDNGNSWLVMGVTKGSEKDDFILELKILEKEPDSTIQPVFGGSPRCGIVTPVNGFVAPFWSSLFVSNDISRIAAILTMNGAERYWSNEMEGVDLGTVSL